MVWSTEQRPWHGHCWRFAVQSIDGFKKLTDPCRHYIAAQVRCSALCSIAKAQAATLSSQSSGLLCQSAASDRGMALARPCAAHSAGPAVADVIRSARSHPAIAHRLHPFARSLIACTLLHDARSARSLLAHVCAMHAALAHCLHTRAGFAHAACDRAGDQTAALIRAALRPIRDGQSTYSRRPVLLCTTTRHGAVTRSCCRACAWRGRQAEPLALQPAAPYIVRYLCCAICVAPPVSQHVVPIDSRAALHVCVSVSVSVQ